MNLNNKKVSADEARVEEIEQESKSVELSAQDLDKVAGGTRPTGKAPMVYMR
jgi:hypothetical protein